MNGDSGGQFATNRFIQTPQKEKNDNKTTIIKGVNLSLNREKSFKDILEGLQRPFDVEKELLRHTR